MKDTEKKITEAIKRLGENNLFSDVARKDLIDACIDHLSSVGYRIYKPLNYTYKKVTTIDKLIELFYALYRRNHPSEICMSRNKTALDRKVAKNFVAKRMEVGGLAKKYALMECAEIIDTLFEFEKDFNFETGVNFGLLGQDKLKWVTDKAIFLLNNKKEARSKRDHLKMHVELEELYEATEDEEIGFDLDKILETLKESN